MRFLALTALLLGVAHAAAARPSVVVTFAPYASVVRDVAAPDADVIQLVPSGANPHAFEPKPGDVRAVAGAELVVLAGLGVDAWMDPLVKSSGTRARVLRIGERVPFTPISSHADERGVEHADGHADEGATDPHVWLDASIMARAATLLGEELAKADPARAAAY
ncbi:metal ABC transporter substrate-binding protein, partial [Deinococcus pimensis]|uniref:metal ABC transporter substrate-binding protein n=1 Tax=Deinococcus pimensis TaxID=309888 RepID=UPI0012F95C8B